MTSKNVVTFKSGSKVPGGHRNQHGSIRRIWLPNRPTVTYMER